MTEKVDFSDLSLNLTQVEKEPEEPEKGKKKPAKKKAVKKPSKKLSESELEKRVKSNRIKAWLIVSGILVTLALIAFAGLSAAFNERPLSQVRAFVNQSNSQTAFKEAGVQAYLQTSFNKYIDEKGGELSGMDPLTISSIEISRITKITDTLAMVNFVADVSGSSGEKTQTAWSVMLNDEGVKGYSIADNFRNVPVPLLDEKAKPTELMSFKDLPVAKPEDIKSASAFMGNFLTNFFQNNKEVVESMYSNPDEVLVFNNRGEFKQITDLKLFGAPNQMGYNGIVEYEFILDGNVIRTTKYILLEAKPTPMVKRLL